MRRAWIYLLLAPLAMAQDAAQRGALRLSLKRAVEIATSGAIRTRRSRTSRSAGRSRGSVWSDSRSAARKSS